MTTLIFDCDGVLADTERDGHLPAFNQTFAELGLPVRWSDQDYARLVRIGGGKERMATLLTPEFVRAHDLPSTAEGQRELLADWHRRKTEIFQSRVREGRLPARPGVARIAAQADEAGWVLAVASTSARSSVEEVLVDVMGEALAARFAVFAGDAVERKKPEPDIYLLACGSTGADPADTLVVEDSGVGVAAARAAGLPVVVTVSSYTAEDDVDGAALVLSSLGSSEEPARVLSDPHDLGPGEQLQLEDLRAVLEIERSARI